MGGSCILASTTGAVLGALAPVLPIHVHSHLPSLRLASESLIRIAHPSSLSHLFPDPKRTTQSLPAPRVNECLERDILVLKCTSAINGGGGLVF